MGSKLTILYKLSPGTNVFVWFGESGFIYATFQRIDGETAEFTIGGSLLLRVLAEEIKAIIV